MVSAGWWQSAPLPQRQHAIAGRMLVLPDGTWWLFGAWARWYRMHPSDGQWYLCPPPRTAATRMAARPAQQTGQLPALPPHVIPAGPDFAYRAPAALPFVGRTFTSDLTGGVRATIEQAAALPAADYPHWWTLFSGETPSTVAVAWGVMLWCAAAPVFDARYDEQMLGLWADYRAKPLPAVDGPRWLTPPPLEALVGLYAERLRASRVDAAVSVLRTMWAMASALREDDRFRARADALLAILTTTLSNPTVDYGALPYGDQALVQQWLTRCPPHLAPALRDESSPGDNVRHAYYDLAEAVAEVAGDANDPAYLEPRLVAAALIAADLAKVRQDVAGRIVPWLDPEIRYTVQAVHGQLGHPLRRLWPVDLQLPEPLLSHLRGTSGVAEPLLAAAYRADLAWCRLAGIPARPRGFPVPTAILAEIIGPDRARVAQAASTTPPPNPVQQQPSAGYAQPSPPSPPSSPSSGPPQPSPGFGASPGYAAPDPGLPGPGYGGPPGGGQGTPGYGASPGWGAAPPGGGQPPAGYEQASEQGPPAPGDPGGFGQAEPGQPFVQGPGIGVVQPEAEQQQEENWVPPYTQLGFASPGQAAPVQAPQVPAPPVQAPQVQASPVQAGVGYEVDYEQPPPLPTPEAESEVFATRFDQGPAQPPRTRTLGTDDIEPPAPPEPPKPPGTRMMSETMIGDFEYLEESAPQPSRPVHEIAPPPTGTQRRQVTERYGIGFVSGDRDFTELLDDLRVHPAWSQQAEADVEETRVDGRPGAGTPPSVLLVGSPHTGQRRLARLIALTLADAGIGDGAIRTADAADVRDAPPEALASVLEPGGPTLLFERLDVAILDSADPQATARVVRSVRGRPGQTTLIATCEPGHFRRLAEEHPKLAGLFEVYRLPDLTRLDNRMTLLHLLAEERRVTLGSSALDQAEEDLGRLRGPGDLVNARLVEAYLEQAVQRHLATAGAARDRLALTRSDFAGVAAAIEPALRPPGDVDGYLDQLAGLLGLDEVKQTVEDLVAEARLAVERARHGVRAGGQSRHLIFQGPPGTGKTTVAGLLGGIYAALGLLDSGHVVSCRPVHLTGRSDLDTENRVANMIEQALGGVLLIQEAHRLDRSPAVVRALLRQLEERRDKFLLVCTSPPAEMAGFLAGNPGFRAEFGAVIEFTGLTDRQLVQLFQRSAERDLYLLDEELRAELYDRFSRMRGDADFAYARTAHALFEQTVARQAARLAGADVNAATVARLTVRDLPETPLDQILGGFQQEQGR